MKVMYCSGCGHIIWFWQAREFHDLRANPIRVAVRNASFHPICWRHMPEDAK